MADKREQILPIPFPFAGINLSKAYAAQEPSTTPTAVNVRGFEPGTGRMRGGSRPGLVKYVAGQMPGGGLVQDLDIVVATGITAPGPPTAVVQASAGGTGSAGTAVDVFGSNTTAGNAILVLVGSNNIGTFPTVTDSQGNSYTRINNNSFSSFQAAAYLATGIVGGACTVTAAVGTAVIDLVSVEIQGHLGHENNASPASNGVVINGVNWTAAHAPDVMYCLVWTSKDTTVTRTGGSGYSDLVVGTATNLNVTLRHLAANGSYGSDLQWTLSQSKQLEGVQGGIEVGA